MTGTQGYSITDMKAIKAMNHSLTSPTSPLLDTTPYCTRRTIYHSALGGECPHRPLRQHRSLEDLHCYQCVNRNIGPLPQVNPTSPTPMPSQSPSFTCSNADISGGTLSTVGGSQHISENHYHGTYHRHIDVQNINNYTVTIIDYKTAVVIGLFARGDSRGMSCI
ncbi:hypothetical protein EV361DRAFT_402516 [Lentinula raphanica]|nr:hypothetical protein EV361DRAFT_402516 [Lentinula raphanica]